MDAKLLEGKTAIVTGGSRGIGYAIADVFLQEGANVLISARRPDVVETAVNELKAKENGGKIIGIPADVADHDTMKMLFDEAEKAFGDVDILVNNAGRGDMYTIDRLTDENIQEVFEIDLFSAIRGCREAITRWKERGTGSIINISSVNSWRPICGPAYTSAKAGMNMLGTSLAAYLDDSKIRVNTILPGTTDTDAAAAWADGTMEGGPEQFAHGANYLNTNCPMTSPYDQAYAALYLASDYSVAVRGQKIQVCNAAYL